MSTPKFTILDSKGQYNPQAVEKHLESVKANQTAKTSKPISRVTVKTKDATKKPTELKYYVLQIKSSGKLSELSKLNKIVDSYKYDYSKIITKENFDRIQSVVKLNSSVDSDYIYYNNNVKFFNLKKYTDIYIYAGTELRLEESTIPIDVVALDGVNIFKKYNDRDSGFYGKYLSFLNKESFIQSAAGNFVQKEENITVYLYLRGFEQLINISRYITFCSTVVTGQSNSFSLTFVRPLSAIKDMKITDTIQNKSFDISADNDISKFINQNDLIFIKFEKLKIESEEEINNKTDEVNLSNIVGKFWDMFGLVDSCSNSISYESTDLTTSINGRDFMKVFQDDGAYFYPQMYSDNANSLYFGNKANLQDRWFARNIFSGEFNSFYHYGAKKVNKAIGFIVNQLSSLSVCDIDFSSIGYGSRVGEIGEINQQFDAKGKSESTIQLKKKEGIWGLIDIMYDEDNLSQRYIADSQSMNPQGGIMDLMNSLCQEPFIEIIGDTIGDRYNLIIRQQPFNKQSLTDMVDIAITINPKQILSFDIKKETEYYTSFQLDVSSILAGVSNPLAYLPIIYSPQMAQYFGNRRFSISDNYVWSPDMAGSKTDGVSSVTNEKILNDLLLVIESYSVLPFTRSGTLKICGDRRIKKGTWIKVGLEIYYVDNVTNIYESAQKLDRVTILSIKRGMVIENVVGGGYFNYFNIFKTKKIREDIKKYLNGQKKLDNGSNYNLSYGVNEDVFDYFFTNKQFLYSFNTNIA